MRIASAIFLIGLTLAASSWQSARAVGLRQIPAREGPAPQASKEVYAVESAKFRACFGRDAPLNSESYDCLDDEYHRLDGILTVEYRSALGGQVDEAARQKLERSERDWWHVRFRHCKDGVGEFSGSTAEVINEICEIEALAARIVVLRHYGP